MKLDGVRVLLAEDNPTNQLVATQMLESLGARVTLARDGAEALEIIETQDFDAVLVDIEMPRVSGIDVMRRIRASGGVRAAMPVIALTAYVMREHTEAIDAAGADGVIAKPILSIDQLGEDIHRYMRRRTVGRRSAAEPIPEPNAPSRPVIDQGIYDGLAEAIGREAMSELLGKVAADIRLAEIRLAKGVEAGDMAEIRSASHILISVAGAIGATPVQEGAKEVNAAAHHGDPAKVRELAAWLSEDVAQLREAVRATQTD